MRHCKSSSSDWSRLSVLSASTCSARARAARGPDSDYDLMVVVPGSDLPGYRRDQLAYGALRGVEVAKDILVWTSDEFDRRRHLVASLPATILREKRLIYGG